jgi:hypothetical protein
VIPKITLFRSKAVSAAHETSFYPRHETVLGRPMLLGLRMTFVFISPMIAGMNGVNLGLPKAWVVKRKKCACTITCRAIDPQGQPDRADPAPQDSVIVACSCCWAAYRYSPAEIFKDSPGPSSSCYHRGKPTIKEEKKPDAVLLIAASLIAAVRLNREEIKPSTAVHSKIADSIRLAEMIQTRLRG